MTGVIAINGHSFTIPQGDLTQVPVIDPISGDGSGPTETEQDEANAIKDGASKNLQLDATFSDDYSCCAPVTSEGSKVGSGISLSLDSLGFTSPDFREVGTFALSPSSNGFFYDFYDYISREGENGNSSDIALLPQSLTVSVSGVPEPAAWTMMVAGFAAAGIAARRRRGALRA
ncbi:PEPxxWA-CTERM sorting domain-containing protein [Sphingomonas nostoxanthinifaciens]|nr:PEPxxWA-CTERM sorting domain-containing protein [Sphingomonas nostoxanthinifaciens]